MVGTLADAEAKSAKAATKPASDEPKEAAI
jgi:hypothetical protein